MGEGAQTRRDGMQPGSAGDAVVRCDAKQHNKQAQNLSGATQPGQQVQDSGNTSTHLHAVPVLQHLELL